MQSSLSDALGSLLDHPINADSLLPLLEAGPSTLYLLRPDSFDLVFLQRPDEPFLPASFYSLAEEKGNWLELLGQEDANRYREAIARLDETGKAEIAYRLLSSRRNAWTPVKDFLLPVTDDSGRMAGYCGRLLDDSFRINCLDTLARRSWKEVATTVTRRFLHDFNNTIAGIYSLSELYAEPGSSLESTVEAMRHIRDSSVRAQSITQKIRSLATMVDGESTFADLEKVIEEQKEYIAALLPKGADIEYQLSGKPLPAKFDANRFRQVLLHIASNARDASGDEARFRITCQWQEGDGSHPPLARMEFEDHGAGIKERALAKAFDPFFTTKNPQLHAGMGLFIVKNFVEELGGEVKLASEAGKGTTLSLTIPLFRETPEDSGSASEPPSRQAASHLADRPRQQGLSLLIYSWEDVQRHPLLVAMREAGWRLRIHLDPFQLAVDLKDKDGRWDGALIFKSPLDENVDRLMDEIRRAGTSVPVALLALGEPVESLPAALTEHCSLVLESKGRPNSLLKKLKSVLVQHPSPA